MDGLHEPEKAKSSQARTSISDLRKSRKWLLLALLAQPALFLVYMVVIYSYTDADPSRHIGDLYQWCFIVSAITLMAWENRKLHYVEHPYDFAYLASIIWPLFLPYYLVKSRGGWGLVLFLMFFVLLALEAFVFSVYWIFFSGDRPMSG